MNINKRINGLADFLSGWIDSDVSIVCHTMFFLLFGIIIPLFNLLPWSLSLLILTTIVSLEAIYLEILIQRTVKGHTRELQEVAEDIEDIQEDIQEQADEPQ